MLRIKVELLLWCRIPQSHHVPPLYKLNTALFYKFLGNVSLLGKLLFFFSLNKIGLHSQGTLLFIVSWTWNNWKVLFLTKMILKCTDSHFGKWCWMCTSSSPYPAGISLSQLFWGLCSADNNPYLPTSSENCSQPNSTHLSGDSVPAQLHILRANLGQ